MSNDQIREVFQTDANSVQEHEVVKINFPERLRKRQISIETRLSIRAFGNDIDLWLYPRDSILFGEDTPVHFAKYTPDRQPNITFRLQNGWLRRVGQLLEDPRHFASVVIGTGGVRRRRVNGYIGSQRLVIRSLPQTVVHEYLRKRRSIEDIDESSKYHVVYRINEDVEENYLPPVVDKMVLKERIQESALPHQVPSILYPEILVFVENSIYRERGRDIYRFLEYLMAFWNGVDLLYRSIETPRVRLHISAIVIAEDPEVTPYILNNMMSATHFHPEAAVSAGSFFLYSIKDRFPSDSYDVAVTMTSYSMMHYGRLVLGMAPMEGACKIDDSRKTMSRGTITRDKGGFEGVRTAAHEIGHTFGMKDDFGDSGSLKCSIEDGFIMAGRASYTENTSSFSQCSINKFEESLDKQHLTCLYNVPPRLGKNLPKLMPGKMMSLKEQCKAKVDGASGDPCKYGKVEPLEFCVKHYCDLNGSCVGVFGVADGTPCGNETDRRPRFCLHQKCVSYNGNF